MKYYQHHIGDFDKATRHLTRLERSVYRDLIELYYDTEQPLTLDRAALCRKIIARSNDESTAVEQVLNEFFTETPTGWYHERCESEIEKYRNSNSQKSAAGKASAAKKAAKRQQAMNAIPTSVPTPVERALNERGTELQLTINQEPITKNHSLNTSSPQVATRATANRFEDFWNTYPNTPRRVAKSKCVEKWKALRLDDQADEIIKHVTAMKATEQWREGYEPAPLTYINQRRWSDGIPEIQNTPQPQAKKPVDLWWTTDHGVIAKGKELGLNPRPGETMGEFKGRINLKMNEVPA